MSKPPVLPDTADITTELKTDFRAVLRDMRDFFRKPWALLLSGAIIGALLVFGIRFATLTDDHVHYHANFALYVNGQRDPFKNFNYYEEVASCNSPNVSDPKIRVHMHMPNNHVVHVHDNGVTWGQFFANLGYTLGNDVLKTSDGLFIDGQDGKKLQFILNGTLVPTVANRAVNDRDALLVTYGTEDTPAVQKQYASIQKDAKHFDETADPATCSGHEKLDFTQRLKRTFQLGT